VEGKKGLLWGLICLLLICELSGRVKAKSLYTITKHFESIVQVYETVDDQIKFQYQSDHFPDNGSGAVDLAITSDSGMLFASYDGDEKIELVNAQTMEPYDTKSTPEEIGGLVFDNTSQRLLVMQRRGLTQTELYIYRYNSSTRNLQLGEIKTLKYLDNGYGICLDEKEDRLYVTDNTNVVRYYDIQYYETNDPNFTYAGSIEIKVNGEDKEAVGVAVYNDGEGTKYLYTAGFAHPDPGERHGFLVRTDPNNPDRPGGRVGVPLGTGRSAVGLAVDDTGLLYATTYHGTEDDSIQVYDPLNWPSDPCEITPTQTITNEYISGPAGLVVGPQYVPPFEVVKIDDVDGCASPRGEEITYTISLDYQWDGYEDPNIIDSIKIMDYLPREVDFDSAQPDTGQYEYDDPNGGWYTWILTDANSFEETQSFKLIVESQNARLTPGGVFENVVEVIANIEQYEHSVGFTLQMHVCDCTGYAEVIYVDKNVPDPCDGSSWDKAFEELKDAIAVALPCDEIWVADGTYEPTADPCDTNATFSMVNGVGVYGGFEGGEEYRYERDWADPEKETILSGDINGSVNVDYVVVSDANAPVSALDGFTIKNGSVAAIYCEDSSLVIQHNKIMTSGAGIYCKNTEQPVIKNNWIYRNDCGMYFDEPGDAPIVRNNTIAYNTDYGISASDIDPNISISNCILWGNGTQLNLDFVPTYSCIQNWTQGGTENISSDPCFVSAGTDDYHLEGVSACIDAGDPCGNYGSERDIDKHFRVLDGKGDGEKIVDMGADEYCNEGSSNSADFNNDYIVDTNDLRELAGAWLIDSDDPDWESQYEKYDLYTDDNVINYRDFAYFARQWLWMTCEKMQGYEMMEMMMGMGGGMGKMAGAESMLISEPAAEQQVSETQPEPSVAEQIEIVKRCLEFWYRQDVREGIEDEDAWLRMVTILEEMLKELEGE